MFGRTLPYVSLFVCVLLFARIEAQQTPTAVGDWSGSIAIPNSPLDIGVTLRQDASTWSATIDIPAQGNTGVPLTAIVVDGTRVSFQLPGRPGTPTFTLRLSDDGAHMNGTFTQAGATLPVNLVRGTLKALNRPQEPKGPFPYREEMVTYRNTSAQVQLAGTLTLPQGGGPFPAILLITGSGSQDRNNTILGHKPFFVIADYLTRKGIAVLRVDDRGVGGSDLGPLTATSEDFAGDVRTGVSFLKLRKDIDPQRIGLLGHSEGAAVAAMVAANSTDVSFIVMLGGAGLPGDQILYLQSAALAKTQRAPADAIAWDRSVRQRVYELLKSEPNGVADEGRRRELIQSTPPSPGAPPGSGGVVTKALLDTSSSPWFRYFIAYDPAPTLQRVKCPVLAILGDNDLQVPAPENQAAITAALKAGGNRDYTVTSLPKLNHLFQTSVTGSVDEYGRIEETLAPSALTLIGDWIGMHTGRR